MTLDVRLHVLIDAPLMRLLRAEAKRKRQSLADVTRSALADHLMRETLAATPATGEPTR